MKTQSNWSAAALWVVGLLAVLGSMVSVVGAVTPSTSPPDAEAAFLARRAARLEKLSAPPEPPVVAGEDLDAIDRFLVARIRSIDSASRAFSYRRCDDATFARRVYLDLIGVIPTVPELSKFLTDRSPDSRAKLIDQLLARRNDYAAHWVPFWEEALGSQLIDSQGGIPTRGNFRPWLEQSLAANRPFDLLVAELIDPALPKRRPTKQIEILGRTYTIDYVRHDDHTLTLQTAADVGQVFLGTSMKCAGCHDHFERRAWTQDRFLGFASFFAPRDVEHIRCEVPSGRTVPARFPFDVPDAELTAPDEPTERLQRAAALITDPANPRFARTIVNRLWRRYLGLGLVEPVDDYGDDSAAAAPPLLTWLAHDFATHGYDLQHTIRLILNSQAYQAAFDPQLADRYSAGQTEALYMRSPKLRRLTAEQFLDSVRQATSEKLAPAERAYLDARSTALMRVLGKPASRGEISTSRPDDVAIVQSLELLNGPELQQLIDEAVILHKPVRKVDLPKVVDRLYRGFLTRVPTSDEKRLAVTILSAEANLNDGVKDLMWALVCSPEFQYLK